MKARVPAALAVFFLLLFASGCQTVESRIKEKPTVFASVDQTTQEKIKQGVIGLGYTQDMVYLALGNPDQIRESVTASAHTLIWIYNSYSVHYDGVAMMGYYGSPYYPYYYPYRRGPYGYYGYYYPPFADAYHSEVEERIRVTFNEGKVTAIDQVQN